MSGVADERLNTIAIVEMLGKQAFAKSNGLTLLHLVQTMGLPDFFRGFDNESGHLIVKLVSMGCKPAVLGLLKSKGERIKLFTRTQPDKAALAGVNIRLKHISIAGADAAVQAITGDDQVCVVLRSNDLIILHIGLKHQIYT